MKISQTAIPDVLLVEPSRFSDARGHFGVVWNDEQARVGGLATTIVQINESLSTKAGTLRGLHYQAPPFAQAKLVRVLHGAILDVAVDFRRGSPHFGQWVGVELTSENGCMLHLPRGFLHGFITRAPDTVVSYCVDNAYDRLSEGAVRFDDPDLAIDWGTTEERVFLSEKDAAAPAFATVQTPFDFGDAA